VEKIVEDLVNDVTTRTPPESMSSQRLFDSRNNIQRSSPFKSLVRSGRGPATPRSPEITSDINEDDEASSPSTIRDYSFTAHSARNKGWEDLVDGGAATSKPPKSKAKRTSDEPFDGPSFTLHDILLKVGQDGLLGANGTFNLDLLGMCAVPSRIRHATDTLFCGILAVCTLQTKPKSMEERRVCCWTRRGSKGPTPSTPRRSAEWGDSCVDRDQNSVYERSVRNKETVMREAGTSWAWQLVAFDFIFKSAAFMQELSLAKLHLFLVPVSSVDFTNFERVCQSLAIPRNVDDEKAAIHERHPVPQT
jgi:hypothetical protein